MNWFINHQKGIVLYEYGSDYLTLLGNFMDHCLKSGPVLLITNKPKRWTNKENIQLLSQTTELPTDEIGLLPLSEINSNYGPQYSAELLLVVIEEADTAYNTIFETWDMVKVKRILLLSHISCLESYTRMLHLFQLLKLSREMNPNLWKQLLSNFEERKKFMDENMFLCTRKPLEKQRTLFPIIPTIKMLPPNDEKNAGDTLIYQIKDILETRGLFTPKNKLVWEWKKRQMLNSIHPLLAFAAKIECEEDMYNRNHNNWTNNNSVLLSRLLRLVKPKGVCVCCRNMLERNCDEPEIEEENESREQDCNTSETKRGCVYVCKKCSAVKEIPVFWFKKICKVNTKILDQILQFVKEKQNETVALVLFSHNLIEFMLGWLRRQKLEPYLMSKSVGDKVSKLRIVDGRDATQNMLSSVEHLVFLETEFNEKKLDYLLSLTPQAKSMTYFMSRTSEMAQNKTENWIKSRSRMNAFIFSNKDLNLYL